MQNLRLNFFTFGGVASPKEKTKKVCSVLAGLRASAVLVYRPSLTTTERRVSWRPSSPSDVPGSPRPSEFKGSSAVRIQIMVDDKRCAEFRTNASVVVGCQSIERNEPGPFQFVPPTGSEPARVIIAPSEKKDYSRHAVRLEPLNQSRTGVHNLTRSALQIKSGSVDRIQGGTKIDQQLPFEIRFPDCVMRVADDNDTGVFSTRPTPPISSTKEKKSPPRCADGGLRASRRPRSLDANNGVGISANPFLIGFHSSRGVRARRHRRNGWRSRFPLPRRSVERSCTIPT